MFALLRLVPWLPSSGWLTVVEVERGFSCLMFFRFGICGGGVLSRVAVFGGRGSAGGDSVGAVQPLLPCRF